MQVKFYCDLYISENWMNKKRKIMARLQKNRLQPAVYVIALSQGEQNQLEIFSAMLMKQHVLTTRNFLSWESRTDIWMRSILWKR